VPLFFAGLTGSHADVEIVGIVPEDINSCMLGISDSLGGSFQRAVDEVVQRVLFLSKIG